MGRSRRFLVVSRSNREHEKCYVADGLEVIGIIPEHLADRFSGKQAIRSKHRPGTQKAFYLYGFSRHTTLKCSFASVARLSVALGP